MTSRREKSGQCQLCERLTSLTFHHLIPRKVHRRNAFRKKYTATQLNAGINICRLCHNGIHKLYNENQLARQLNTYQALSNDEAIMRHVQWVARQKGR